MIEDQSLRDFLKCALQQNREQRSTLYELAKHSFFDPENTSNNDSEVKICVPIFNELVTEINVQKEKMKQN